MGDSETAEGRGVEDRVAKCNPDPPDVDNPPEVLRHLLQVELDRLDTAREIEQERDIVFPETTVIVRDIRQLMKALRKWEPDEQEADHKEDSRDSDTNRIELKEVRPRGADV